MNTVLKHNLILLVSLIACSFLIVVLPLYMIKPILGKTLLASIPPMLIFTLSWMIPFWRFHNNNALLVPATLGLMPIRIMLCMAYSYMILEAVPEINPAYLIGGLMWHWILFAIPEINIMLSTTTRSDLESFLISEKTKKER